MDGLFGSDAGAAIVGGVIILLMILGVLIAADRKTKEIMKERNSDEDDFDLEQKVPENLISPPVVAPPPSRIQLPPPAPVNNIQRPLMSSELHNSSISEPSSSNSSIVPQKTEDEKWTDSQLSSAGWSKQQIESYRSEQKAPSKNESKESEDWDMEW